MRHFLALVFLVILCPGWVQAQPEQKLPRLKSRIFRLEAEARRLELKLNNIQTDSKRITDELNQFELERAIIAGKLESHELELEQAQNQIFATEQEQKALEGRVGLQEKVIGRRLKQIYKRGNLGYTQLFLKQSRISELINAYHYARILTDRDNKILNEFKRTHQQLESVKQVLRRVGAEAEDARRNMQTRQLELNDLMVLRTKKLNDIRQKESRQKKLFNELELEREELELMVRRLTEDDASPWELRVPITRYKGKLTWPVIGTVRRKFGIIRDPEFNTKRRHNGLNLAVAKGRPIRVVYSGRVLYADWFKNYGNLIIVDHGEKITSFYAHCDRLLVAKGDFIERNQIIAKSGDSASLEGPMLHFEIRQKTKAVDPLFWLKPRTKR